MAHLHPGLMVGPCLPASGILWTASCIQHCHFNTEIAFPMGCQGLTWCSRRGLYRSIAGS